MLPERQHWNTSLPAIVPDAPILSATFEPMHAPAPRILVVDDEQYMCDLCQRTLSRAGYDVTATTDAVAALKLVEQSPFDILLTDIQMPSVSGLELAEQARTVDPTIVIIVMTGHASMDNLQQAVQRGIADFLSKPFELDQMRLTVDQALHKRRLLRENLRLQEMVQLLGSSDAINTSLDLDALSRTIMEIALRETKGRAGVLLLWSHDELLPVEQDDEAQQVLPAGLALARRTLERAEMQVADGSAALLHTGDALLSEGVALPLRAQGEVVGVLLLCVEADGNRPRSYQALSILLNQAGSAIRNAQRHRELQATYTRLQELDHMKSEFIAVASHELRTPLSMVIGYTTLIRDQLDGQQRSYLQRVLDNARRIQAIVDDMISLRHLERGQDQAQLRAGDVNMLLAEVCAQLRPAAEEKSQELRLRPGTLRQHCLFDHDKLKVVLVQLLSNAIKFTSRTGWIELRLEVFDHNPLALAQGQRLVVTQRATAARWMLIEVQDNGVGIAPEDQMRIFERFYQAAESLTRDQGGTGLGLALVKELVAVMGGWLAVASAHGHGSTFSLALPLRLA